VLSIERKWPIVIEHFLQPSVALCVCVCLSVCLSVCPLHCDKMADKISIQFVMVCRMGPGMRQIVRFGDRSTGGGIWGECVSPHCNQ